MRHDRQQRNAFCAAHGAQEPLRRRSIVGLLRIEAVGGDLVQEGGSPVLRLALWGHPVLLAPLRATDAEGCRLRSHHRSVSRWYGRRVIRGNSVK